MSNSRSWKLERKHFLSGPNSNIYHGGFIKLPTFVRNHVSSKRSTERKWRNSRSNSDLILYKAKINNLTFIMKAARTAYYHKFIEDSSSNQRILFKALKQLLNLKQNSVFSDRSTSESEKLANEIGTFFIQKNEKIRSKLDINITSPNDSHISYSDPPINQSIIYWN